MSNNLEPYLTQLGLEQDATLEEINTAYFMILKRLPENPTEEEEEYQKQVVRAYAVIKRSYVAPVESGVARLPINRSLLVPVAAALMVVLAVTVLVLNFGTLKVMMTHHETGVVLRWRNQTEPFGQVVGYDATHKFDKGDPFPAYQIRLAAREETIWLSERLVVRGMVPIEGAGGSSQPASVAPRN